MHAVGRVRPLLALRVSVVRQDPAEGCRHLVTVGGDREAGPHQVDLGRRLAEGAVLQYVDPRRQGDRHCIA